MQKISPNTPCTAQAWRLYCVYLGHDRVFLLSVQLRLINPTTMEEQKNMQQLGEDQVAAPAPAEAPAQAEGAAPVVEAPAETQEQKPEENIA